MYLKKVLMQLLHIAESIWITLHVKKHENQKPELENELKNTALNRPNFYKLVGEVSPPKVR